MEVLAAKEMVVAVMVVMAATEEREWAAPVATGGPAELAAQKEACTDRK